MHDAEDRQRGEPMCKGDMLIGSGCGKCRRCQERTLELDALARQRGENLDGSPRRETVQVDQWDEKTRGKKMSEATGRVIFKYQMPVLESFSMKLPKGAEIIRMQDQGGMFWLWALVRTDVPDEERRFHAFKCGGKIPDDLNLKYVGFCAVFVQQELGLYIFEEIA